MSEVTALAVIPGPPSAELVKAAREVYELAATYRICSPEMREASSTDLQRVKGIYKTLEENRLTIVRHHERQKASETLPYAKPIEYCTMAETALKSAMTAWDTEQDRKRREKEAADRATAEAARKKLEDEARAVEAEQRRKEKEAKEATEAAAQKEREAAAAIAAGNVQEAAKATREASALTRSAEDLTASAAVDSSVADTLVDAAQGASLMVGPSIAAPKFAGESNRLLWNAEVHTFRDLCRAIADGTQPESLAQPNMAALNARAKTDKEHFNVPGCKAVSRRNLASRAA